MSKTKRCRCIQQCNAELARINSNTRIDVPFQFDFKTGKPLPPRMFVAVCKADEKRRTKPTPIAAAYCPVCGRKYE